MVGLLIKKIVSKRFSCNHIIFLRNRYIVNTIRIKMVSGSQCFTIRLQQLYCTVMDTQKIIMAQGITISQKQCISLYREPITHLSITKKKILLCIKAQIPVCTIYRAKKKKVAIKKASFIKCSPLKPINPHNITR